MNSYANIAPYANTAPYAIHLHLYDIYR